MSIAAGIIKLYLRVKTIFLEQLGVPFVDYLFFKFGSKEYGNRPLCLIVKPDAIGDYVLFRSFIHSLKAENSPVKNHRLILLGNHQYKGLYEAFDKDFFDDALWINRIAFCRNLTYRQKVVRQLKSMAIDTWIYPVYHRDFHFDRLLQYLKPRQAHSMDGGYGNSSKATIEKYNRFYTDLFLPPADAIHELDKYRLFLGRICKMRFEAETCIKIPDFSGIKNPYSGHDYFVVFPGASVKSKQWSVNNFIRVANYIREVKGWQVLIAGGPAEMEICSLVAAGVESGSINLAGQTSLPLLWKILSESKFLLANDTVAVHMAASFGVKVVCPFNGIHFGAFIPWPRGQGKPVYAALPHGFDPNKDVYFKGIDYPYTIDDVSFEEVLKEVNNAIEPVD